MTTKHRKIYEQHFGKIPKGYHIHHKDGNHSNNHTENLQCVTAQEHFDIHYAQKDYGACWALLATGHLNITPEQRSFISSEQLKHQWENNREKMLNGRRNRDDSCLLGRKWKLSEEVAKKVSSHLKPFDSNTSKICKDTIWINDGLRNKRINKEDLVPEGYTKGRLFTPWNKGKKTHVRFISKLDSQESLCSLSS